MFHRYQYTLAILFLLSIISFLMVLFRVYWTVNYTYLFMLWNLMLAWIPLLCAMVVDFLFRKSGKITVLMLLLSGVWLLFYPNSPYIVTDLLHLKARANIPIWFDLMLILSFAWTGLFLGFMSLYLMQNIIKKKWGSIIGWIFVAGTILIGSFGVFLGRFLRWNSWDMLSEPQAITYDIVSRAINPLSNKWSIMFTVIFFTFSFFSYLLLYSFHHLHKEWDE
jgi:uncharacterized membrane protein